MDTEASKAPVIASEETFTASMAPVASEEAQEASMVFMGATIRSEPLLPNANHCGRGRRGRGRGRGRGRRRRRRRRRSKNLRSKVPRIGICVDTACV